MSKYYVATIMNRHSFTDTTLAFSCDHAIFGKFDEFNEVFIDRQGTKYNKMGSSESLNGEDTVSFANLMTIDELTEYFENNLSIKEAVKQYEKLCKDIIHFVGVNEDGDTFYTPLNTDILYQLSHGLSYSDEDYDEDEDEDEDTFEADLNDIIEDVLDGKYNLEQLRAMRDQFNSNCESIESVVEAIGLKIEAIEDEQMDNNATIKGQEPDEVATATFQETTKLMDKKDKYINIDELFKKVTKTLIAQDEPTRRVIAELARKELDDRKKREGILLTGPTGVGKTELMRLIAKHLDRPFYKINSTQLTIPGYVGKDVEEVLWDLYIQCGRNVKKTEQAIIFFDEIDKKGSRKKEDVSGQGVLNVLLPFIEGATYDACADMKTSREKIKINTSNMTVVLGGAYTDVYKNLLVKNNIGFNEEKSSKPKYRKATTKDFIDYGMMTDEFMGRVTVVKLNDLDVDDIKRVMLESDESAIKIQEAIFNKIGVKLTFTDGFATEVAKKAEKKKTGARGLNGIIDEATWKAFDEVHSHMGVYEEVILDENTVEDASNYQLVKKKK